MSDPKQSIHHLQRATLAVILAGGRGTRLRQLTAHRSKPAVPFGGKFRIIDFALSNCVNSGIRSVSILTQYKSHSLMRHVLQGWSVYRPQFGEFIEMIPAQQRVDENWYMGTADAVFQNLDIIRGHHPEYLLILAGDHVYKMDYSLMMAHHVDLDADITVGSFEIPACNASEFGVMQLGENYRINRFVEKPADPSPFADANGMTSISMGIYFCRADFLAPLLERDAVNDTSSHDFGKDILPSLINDHNVVSCPLGLMGGTGQRYWRDIGTIDAYYKSNMDLTGVTPELNLYDPDWPILTFQEQYPPAKFVFDDDDRRGMAVDSLVAGGCIISGGKVERSLLSTNVRVNSYSHVEDSVILPNVVVGRHCRIRHAIIDKDCHIPEGMVIGHDPAGDRQRFEVSPEGVVVVTEGMLRSLPEPEPLK